MMSRNDRNRDENRENERNGVICKKEERIKQRTL